MHPPNSSHWKCKICSLFLDTVTWKCGGIYFPETPDHLSNLCFSCLCLTNSGNYPNFKQKQMKQNDSDPFAACEAKRDTNAHKNHKESPSGWSMNCLGWQPCCYKSLSSAQIWRHVGKPQVPWNPKSQTQGHFCPSESSAKKRCYAQFNRGGNFLPCTCKSSIPSN